jgi:hypothetical protein
VQEPSSPESQGNHPRARHPDVTAADERASAGDIVGVVRVLTESKYLDGLIRRFEAEHPQLSVAEIDRAVAEAFDDLVRKMQDGTLIRSVAGFVWRAACFNILDALGRRSWEVRGDDDAIASARAGGPAPDDVDDEDDAPEHPADRLHPWTRWRLAIRLAQRLVEQIEVESERNVMRIVIDAIDKGIAHTLEARDIGGILGLSPAHVRKAKERGMKKLARLAHAAGYCDPTLDLQGLGVDDILAEDIEQVHDERELEVAGSIDEEESE